MIKQHTYNLNKTIIVVLLFVFSFLNGFTQEKNCFPRVRDFQFVYDQADVLSTSEEQTLNNKLKEFTKSTSNVLVVVTTSDLCGYDKAEYTYTFADKNGIGRSDVDNGVVLMVKPKYGNEQGHTFIAVGNGLQGVIPDLVASRDIVRKELIPNFKLNDYYGGITNATNVIISLATGEISHENYGAKQEGDGLWMIIVFFIIFFVLVALSQKYGNGGGDDWENFGGGGKRTGRHRGTSYPWWIHMGGGSRGGSGWNGGGGSGGFGGGGFGGFGGGGFDGGGAGGSW